MGKKRQQWGIKKKLSKNRKQILKQMEREEKRELRCGADPRMEEQKGEWEQREGDWAALRKKQMEIDSGLG